MSKIVEESLTAVIADLTKQLAALRREREKDRRALRLCVEELEFDAANVNYGGEKRIVDQALNFARSRLEQP